MVLKVDLKSVGYGDYEECELSEIVGQEIINIYCIHKNCSSSETDSINFVTKKGEYSLTHNQECCESVWLESVDGNLNDAIGDTVISFELETNVVKPEPVDEYCYVAEYGMWSFYKLTTSKNMFTIRFMGESNGYYSVCVEFYRINENEQ